MTACANPECRAVLDPERVRKYGAKTCNAACRAAAFRARHGIGRVSGGAGAPVAREGRANGSRKPNAAGLQVSYRKAAVVLAEHLASEEFHWFEGGDEECAAVAERWLREALSDAQRARLDARG